MSHISEPGVLQSFDLSGRISLITGGGGHLGSAMASALAEAGSRVVVTSRDVQRAKSVASLLPNPLQIEHLGVELDQMDASSIDRCFESTIQVTGRVDVLVNNAHEATTAD